MADKQISTEDLAKVITSLTESIGTLSKDLEAVKDKEEKLAKQVTAINYELNREVSDNKW